MKGSKLDIDSLLIDKRFEGSGKQGNSEKQNEPGSNDQSHIAHRFITKWLIKNDLLNRSYDKKETKPHHDGPKPPLPEALPFKKIYIFPSHLQLFILPY